MSVMYQDMERNNVAVTAASATVTNGHLENNRAYQVALELSQMSMMPPIDTFNPSSQNESVAVAVSEPMPTSNPNFTVNAMNNALTEERHRRSQNMTECVPVPSSEHVAEIVGRQGCKIKALRAKTNTYIKTPVRGEEPVFVVTGRREDVEQAKKEILSAADHFSQIRASRKSHLNGSLAPGPPHHIPGQITTQVRVPYRVVGLVVGPKGATIKRIQQQTHTYIVTPSREKEPVFEVTGLPENVAVARKEIEAHIAMRTGGNLLDEDNEFLASLDTFSPDLVAPYFKYSNGGLPGLGNLNNDLGGLATSSGNLSLATTLTNTASRLGLTGGIADSAGGLTLNLSTPLGFNDVGGPALSSRPTLGDSLGVVGRNPLGMTTVPNTAEDLDSRVTAKVNSMASSFNSFKYGMPDTSSAFMSYTETNNDSEVSSLFKGFPGIMPPQSGPQRPATTVGSELYDPALGGSIWRDRMGKTSDLGLCGLTSLRRGSEGSSPRTSPHPLTRRQISDPFPTSFSKHSSDSLVDGMVDMILDDDKAQTGSPSSGFISQEDGSRSPSRPNSKSSSNQDLNIDIGPELLVKRDDSPSSLSPRSCEMCSKGEVNAALVPCGHNRLCLECARRLQDRPDGVCPACQEGVNDAIRIRV